MLPVLSLVFVENHSDGSKIVCFKQIRGDRSVQYVCQCKEIALKFRAAFSACFCDFRRSERHSSPLGS
jgi:hypothetical protein